MSATVMALITVLLPHTRRAAGSKTRVRKPRVRNARQKISAPERPRRKRSILRDRPVIRQPSRPIKTTMGADTFRSRVLPIFTLTIHGARPLYRRIWPRSWIPYGRRKSRALLVRRSSQCRPVRLRLRCDWNWDGIPCHLRRSDHAVVSGL